MQAFHRGSDLPPCLCYCHSRLCFIHLIFPLTRRTMLPVTQCGSGRRSCSAFLRSCRLLQASSSCGAPVLSSRLMAKTPRMRQYTTLWQGIHKGPFLTRVIERGNHPVQRYFNTESDYHTAADEALEDIQDSIEEALEDHRIPEFEVTLASGVLTLVFPPHGTWVINKQTPNRQLWWSSPISGPRRYEYESGDWIFTRDESHTMTLRQALKAEIQEIYQVEVDL